MTTRFVSVRLRILCPIVACALIVSGLPLAAREANSPSMWHEFVASVGSGGLVLVSLNDGSRLRGTIVQVRDDDVALKLDTRIPVPPRRVAFADIIAVELQRRGWSPGRKVATGVLSGVGAMLVIVAIALAGLRD